jgi:phenylpropionate dioxygenase-like ring-hydroxylating dioxygenase large terminal subunit
MSASPSFGRSEPEGPNGPPAQYRSAWTPSHVVDPQVWAAEQDLVFARNWVAVARSIDVASPGDFLCVNVVDEPVVVIRKEDGSLIALSNVCRHRGTTVITGTGTARVLQCPNHRWTYNLDGTLASAPSMGDAEIYKSALCLPRFSVCEWQGWVMVNLSGTARPLNESLAGLTELLKTASFASMVRVGSLPFPSPWNWKISIENFAESYHHQSVHPETLQPIFPGAQSFVVDAGGQPWTWLDHVSVDESVAPFTASIVFPTLMFSWIRPNAMAWFHVVPVSAVETSLSIEVFVQPADANNRAFVEFLLGSLHQINSEDININRRTFEGLKSRHASMGPLSPLEGAVAQFRAWVLAQLGAERSAGL